MGMLLGGISWGALVIGGVFILWKVYLFAAWNMERAIFLSSVSAYLSVDRKSRKPKLVPAAK